MIYFYVALTCNGENCTPVTDQNSQLAQRWSPARPTSVRTRLSSPLLGYFFFFFSSFSPSLSASSLLSLALL